jgi:hypothetical protein
MHFKMIKKTTQLKNLMRAYCARQSLQMDQIRFLFDGKRIWAGSRGPDQDYLNYIYETDTPDEVGMEDGDVIDAMLFQTGDIGIWGPPAGSSGGGLLRDKTALLHASAADAQRIIAAHLAGRRSAQVQGRLAGLRHFHPGSDAGRVLHGVGAFEHGGARQGAGVPGRPVPGAGLMPYMPCMYIFLICLVRETDLVLNFHTDTSLYVCLI